MKKHPRLLWLLGCAGIIVHLISLSSCATGPAEQRIDNIPMYGQPNIPRPDVLKKADEDFIKQASSGFGGSREAASKAWFAEAEKFMSQGNLDFAMRRYNQSWLLNPNNYQPYWGFGRAMLERDKMDEAIEYLEKAIKLCEDPYQKVAIISDTATAYSYKAKSVPTNMAEERARNFKTANKYFMECTKLDPNYPNAWERWAHSLYREGKYSESWEKIKKAKLLGARDTEVFVGNLKKKMPEPK